jgi:hypothetical protein
MESPDATARFLRYMPDGFAVHVGKEQGYFFDAKIGRSIEKDAYLAYMAFAGEDRRVYVCVKWSGAVYWIPVRSLSFMDSADYVEQFSPEKRMPIDEDGWIAPRLWPRPKYMGWKMMHPAASGTAFRYLDFLAMTQYRWMAAEVARR